MRFYKTPRIIRQLSHRSEWIKSVSSPVIYLTFDDGPVPEITEYVLEQLGYYSAKATFFCVGDNIRKHPSIFQALIRQGHALGNHTFNHLDGWKTDDFLYFNNIGICQKYIQKYDVNQPSPENAQVHKPMFRPPYGKIKRSQYKNLVDKYRIIMWDVLSYDFDASLNKEVCLTKTLQHTEKGSIVLFHDSIKSIQTLKFVLPRYLEHFKSLGFSFESLDQ